MKRFAVLVLSICTTVVILTIGASRHGPLLPSKLESLGLGRCQDKPCFLNIVPGETSWDEARDILAPYRQLKFTNMVGVIVGGQTVFADSFSRPRRSLDVISIWLPLSRFSVGSAIREFGI